MKKFIVICLVIAAFLNMRALLDMVNPPPNFASIAEGKVVVYTTSTCGYCLITKRLFKNMNLKYSEFDIEKSPEGYRQYMQLGGQGVPLIVIGNTVIQGYGKDQIIAALRQI